jgi:hypothetical protein
MAMNDQDSSRSTPRYGAIVAAFVAIVLGIVVIVATLYRSGSFSVVAQSQGLGSVELKFDQSQVSLSDILDRLLSDEPGSGVDTAARRRLISNILKAHDFYYIPSDDAVTALRRMKTTKSTREFMREVRGLLYDLSGPFSRPDTFIDAPDGRLLQALDDLYNQSPSSPLAVALWEMNLNLQGIFNPRAINASIQLDPSLGNGIAATCTGSPLLEKVGIIQPVVNNDEPQPMIRVFIQKSRMCQATKAEDLLGGKETTVWVSQADMNNLIIDRSTTTNGGVHAKLLPQASTLVGE